jgi:hypothetical protein
MFYRGTFPQSWVSPSLPLHQSASSESAMERANFALAPQACASERTIGSLRHEPPGGSSQSGVRVGGKAEYLTVAKLRCLLDI